MVPEELENEVIMEKKPQKLKWWPEGPKAFNCPGNDGNMLLKERPRQSGPGSSVGNKLETQKS